MKQFNYLAMGLLATAALTLNSCSKEDDLNGNNTPASQQDAQFYMTVSIEGEQSQGTRSELTAEAPATAEESKVTSGTFFLYDEDGAEAYKKYISESEWQNAQVPVQGATGSTTLKIPVQNVKQDKTYKIYFLANVDDATPLTSTLTATATTAQPFMGTYAADNHFAMFNQNDKTQHADAYEISFIEANKNAATPATIASGKAIKIERLAARIDAPKVTSSTTISEPSEEQLADLTAEQIAAMRDAKQAIKSINFDSYAISNLAKKSYIMQNWTADWQSLNIPDGMTYFQAYTDFGTTQKNEGKGFFGNKDQNYVFENTAITSENDATTMYFKYKVVLNDEYTTSPDFTDGTFYRYNGKIYSNLSAIINDGMHGVNPFGKEVAKVLTEDLKKDTEGRLGANEDELEAFRDKYQIEVFEQGFAYYRTIIQDLNYLRADWSSILRNSIYQLTVNSIYNLGTDVPNGKPEELKPVYYLNVSVDVNPWILNEIGIDLQ